MSTTTTQRRPPRPPAAHIDDAALAAIPPALRDARQWVVWQWRWKAEKSKWDKPPIDPTTGEEIDQTDPVNWHTLDEARRMARNRGDGVGIALGPKDNRLGVVGIDLDHCVDADGQIGDEARAIVERFDSYTERTPSGRGLRILISGAKPGERCRTKDRPGIELYDSDRYLTVTGRHLDGTPTQICRRDDVLAAFYREMFDDPPKDAAPPPNGQPNGRPSPPADDSDDALIERARRAKNGVKFAALFDDGDTGDYQGDESSADMALATMLAFWTGRDAGRIEALFGRSALGQRGKWRDRPDYRQRTIQRAVETCSEVYTPDAGRPRIRRDGKHGGDGAGVNGHAGANGHGGKTSEDSIPQAARPDIIVTTEEHLAVNEAVEALRGAPRLFQRGGSLVTILAECRPTPKRHDPTRPPGSLRIAVLPNPQIRLLMSQHARWWRFAKGKGDDAEAVPITPPGAIVDEVATLGVWPGIRPIEGLTECPTLRPDGSLVDTPGYDDDTGLWYEPSGEFPAVSARPTLEDARAAVAILYELVADFPFSDDQYRATWLAAMLTPLGRWGIDGPCPMFLFDANTPGTGKSKLCDLIAIVTTGREMPRGDYPAESDEMQKMLLSAVMGGDRLLMFDNVPTGFAIGGSALDRALTARTMKGRILGKSQMTPELPVDVVFYATGNNLGLRGDALRRVVPCRLETVEERPEERRDFRLTKGCPCGCRGDLLSHAKRARGRLAAAGLTILRAYVEAGRPDQDLTPMDFPAWSGLIRNAVHWATGVDPCAGRKDLIANDEETGQHRAIVDGWKALCESVGKDGVTAAEAVLEIERNGANHPAIRDVFAGWARDGKLPSSRSVGNHLNKIKGRTIGGKRLDCAPYAGNRLWFVKAVPTHGFGGSGGSGGSAFPATSRENGSHNYVSTQGASQGQVGKPEPPEPPEPPRSDVPDWRNPDPTPY